MRGREEAGVGTMRTATNLSITVAGLALVTSGLALSAPAQAAAETCQGKPATIVQASGTVNGTDGADVIVAGDLVSSSKITVLAGKGDDTVCIRVGDLAYDVVDGGAGVDSVEARSPSFAEGSLRIVDFEHLTLRRNVRFNVDYESRGMLTPVRVASAFISMRTFARFIAGRRKARAADMRRPFLVEIW